MNILIITPFYAPAYAYGGIVAVAESHARELSKRGYTVTVATTDVLDAASRHPVSHEWRDRVEIFRFSNVSNRLANRYNLYLPRGFSRWLREHISRYDAIFIHDVYTMLTLWGARLARQHRIPYFLVPHGALSPVRIRMRHMRIKRLLLRMSESIFSAAECVLALHAQEAKEVKTISSRARVTIFPNAIDPDTIPDIDRARARWSLDIGTDVRIVGFLGRIHPVKGLDIALSAFARLDHERHVWQFHIVGPDDPAERTRLENLAESLDITKKIVWHPSAFGEKKYAYLRAFDVLILSSYSEGLPMAVVESLAVGTPAVVSSACNMPEIDKTGAGIVCDSPAPEEYARAIERIFQDIESYRDCARLLASASFSLQHSIDALAELIRDSVSPR